MSGLLLIAEHRQAPVADRLGPQAPQALRRVQPTLRAALPRHGPALGVEAGLVQLGLAPAVLDLLGVLRAHRGKHPGRLPLAGSLGHLVFPSLADDSSLPKS